MQPQVFEFGRSSWWAKSGPNSFRLDGSRLHFNWHPFIDQLIIPTDDQWQQLSQVCTDVDVWSFPEDCSKPWICDGALYRLEIEWSGKYVRSTGQLCDEPASFRQRVMQLNTSICALVPSHMGTAVELERQRVEKEQREAASREAPILAAALKKRNKEIAAYWRRLLLGEFECVNCKGRDFLLNSYPDKESLVICSRCGWTYPRP